MGSDSLGPMRRREVVVHSPRVDKVAGSLGAGCRRAAVSSSAARRGDMRAHAVGFTGDGRMDADAETFDHFSENKNIFKCMRLAYKN